MNLFFHIILFVIVLLFYIHITNQYKKSEDMEIYELDYKDNDYLQEVCEVKQPSVFSLRLVYPDFFDNVNIDTVEEMENYDVKVKDIKDYFNSDESVDYVLISNKSSHTLLKTDTKGTYITEDNQSFIDETGLYKHFENCDILMKPNMTIQTKYDIMYGSEKSYTPFRYHNDYRHFIVVNNGKVRIKMTPWKSCRYLYPITDYDNYEYKSMIDPWNTQRNYYAEMSKMKFLEFDLFEGQALYIPPYWWYSYQYLDEHTLLSSFTYNNIINCIANTKELSMYYIQQSNTKTKPAKTLDLKITELNDNDNAKKSEDIIEKTEI